MDDRKEPWSDEELKAQAAAFRRLAAHLRARTDVQNIDLMNLAGFCRNCLSRWYQEALAEEGVTLEREAAREAIYGMPYAEWKERYQTPIEDPGSSSAGGA